MSQTSHDDRQPSLRTVDEIHGSVRTLEGAGFSVRRPFPTASLDHFDPFLLLDEMGPVDLAPGEGQGAPDHPHRGFETVSYILDGGLEHKDSQGHHGELGPGDVQWMTAGAGVVHSEMPSRAFLRRGGRMHGFQIWVNLPRADKMMRPRYQEIPAARVPVAESDGGAVKVRVVAGEALGVSAVIETRTPILYLHYTLAPGARVVQHAPRSHNVLAYVFGGEGRFGADEDHDGAIAVDGQMVAFRADGDDIAIAAPADAKAPLELLLLGGIPLREPVARYGPFVMNTRAELSQAVDDFRHGRMGHIPPTMG